MSASTLPAPIKTFGTLAPSVRSWRYLLVPVDETNGNIPPSGDDAAVQRQ
ncbi:hypothetical protein X737_29115 [Mesorhizobium sp. L48C026A00]|nr:hypothetical protein X737_29115 [Mesorhizobium sp. L48C026A00]